MNSFLKILKCGFHHVLVTGYKSHVYHFCSTEIAVQLQEYDTATKIIFTQLKRTGSLLFYNILYVRIHAYLQVNKRNGEGETKSKYFVFVFI